MTRDHARTYTHVDTEEEIPIPPPAMQGLRRFDLDLFISEADKPQMNSDGDHMSVFSDPDSIPAEEGKEAMDQKRNFAAAFAREF